MKHDKHGTKQSSVQIRKHHRISNVHTVCMTYMDNID